MAPLRPGTLLLPVGGDTSAPPRGLSPQQESLTFVASQGSEMVAAAAARRVKALAQKRHDATFI